MPPASLTRRPPDADPWSAGCATPSDPPGFLCPNLCNWSTLTINNMVVSGEGFSPIKAPPASSAPGSSGVLRAAAIGQCGQQVRPGNIQHQRRLERLLHLYPERHCDL